MTPVPSLTRRAALFAALATALSGCGVAEAVSPAGPSLAFTSSEDRHARILVATTRRPVGEARRAPFFGTERGGGLAFAEATLGQAEGGLFGRIGAGESTIRAVTTPVTENAAAAFAGAALGSDVLLYVHGYRETFESAAASAGELSRGIAFRGLPALFAWPSGGATLDYGYDRESALWSRDAFEDLLIALASTPSGGRIHIVAHSMGTLLTLETLRMLRASGGDRAMDRIGAVVLASPDIDIDLFTKGLERLGPDARKITVISATNDRALELSRRLAGGVVRAGAADRDKLAALGVRVADASDFGGGVLNHDLFLSNEEVRAVVKRAIERAR